jgi:hypothetical protein
VQIAKQAEKDPQLLVNPQFTGQALNQVVSACTRAMDFPSNASTPNDQQRRVAAAAGADPVLVAAAYEVLAQPQNAAAVQEALVWVAAVDRSRLEKAAGAALIVDALGPQEPQLQRDVTELRQEVNAINAGLSQVQPVFTQMYQDVSQMRQDIAQLQTTVAQLGADVAQVQAKVGKGRRAGKKKQPPPATSQP